MTQADNDAGDRGQYESLLRQGFEEELAAQIARTPGQEEGKPSYTVTVRYDDWTREELEDKGRRQGIEGYCRMSRSQLIEALRRQ